MNKRSAAFLLSLSLVAMLSVAGASGYIRRGILPTVNAEEQGMTIQLSYMQGVSNWGPTNVYGSATLWPNEELATITVHLLPHLLHGQQFIWWIANTRTQQALRLGTFNTNYAGDATQDVYLLQDLPADANEALVTVWHPGDSATTPGNDRSVAGLVAATAAATSTSTPQASNPNPSVTVPTLIPGLDTKPGHHPTYTGHLQAPVSIHTLPSTGGGPLVHAYSYDTGTW